MLELFPSGVAMVNHADVRLTARPDRALRWLVVTPAMHRISTGAAGHTRWTHRLDKRERH